MTGVPGGAAPGTGPRSADEIARRVFPATPTYAARVATYQQVRAFGHTTFVHPEFGDKLVAADAAARAAIATTEGRPFRESDWRVNRFSGFDGTRGGGLHPWGVAVDFNYDSAPYVMHEVAAQGAETAIDNQVRPVYHRIALLVLGRESVIPTQITAGRTPPAGTAADQANATLLDSLIAENDAMVRYFRMMQDPAELKLFLAGLARDQATWDRIVPSATSPADRPTAIQAQMRQDYEALAGRRGPTALPTDTHPAGVPFGDRPFQGGNPMRRDPQLGFLSIRREIVMALRGQGLRWGGTDFGGPSGDIMHFDMGFQYTAPVRAAAAAAAAASGSAPAPSGAGGAAPPVPAQTAREDLPLQRHEMGTTEEIDERILEPGR
jgi:hypothetical protein